MAIVIVGLGSVGTIIKELCEKHQLRVKAIISPQNPIATLKDLSEVNLSLEDTIIDFSSPEATLAHVALAADKKANIVMGTTRWEKDENAIKNIVHKSGIGFAHTPNFLPEIHDFWQSVLSLGEKLGKSAPATFHVSVFEIRFKTKTTYSGTALHTKTLLEQQHGLILDQKNSFRWNLAGENPIDIRVSFHSDTDVFDLHFSSRDHHKNNRTYAEMALKTAIWLEGKKGYFELNFNMIDEIRSITFSD